MTTKRHLILARNTRINEQGLVTGAGHRKFKPGQSALYVKDEGEAREIEQHYGKHGTNDVHVFEDDKVARFVRNDSSEIHNYTFQGISLNPQKQKVVGDILYVWKFGKWRKVKAALQKRTSGARARR